MINLDFYVGEILDVEPHPNADKLGIFKINIGEEDLTVVSGIFDWYSREELLNKKVIVYRLEKPTKIRGSRAEGNILAIVKPDERPELIFLNDSLKVGLSIR
jgi:methionyl-tRNA synthetase